MRVHCGLFCTGYDLIFRMIWVLIPRCFMVGSVLSVSPKFKERSICSFFIVRYHKRKTKANGMQSKSIVSRNLNRYPFSWQANMTYELPCVWYSGSIWCPLNLAGNRPFQALCKPYVLNGVMGCLLASPSHDTLSSFDGCRRSSGGNLQWREGCAVQNLFHKTAQDWHSQ